jgi:hypothetical protein
MSPETLERLCQEALQRVNYWIARSAAQQTRRMKESWAAHEG